VRVIDLIAFIAIVVPLVLISKYNIKINYQFVNGKMNDLCKIMFTISVRKHIRSDEVL
jgi:NRPS condensation-like uncharacterized protein